MKTILITGTSRGIGFETMKVFIENGWRVIGTSTTGNSDFTHDNYEIYKLDLNETESIDRFVTSLIKSGVKLDALDNNAAAGDDRNNRRDSGVDDATLRRLINVNVINTVYLTEKLVPLMNYDAVIVNVSSEFGSLTEDWGYIGPEYRITKAAINMYTRNLYKDARILAKKIKVYSFDPGWVKTDMGGPQAPGDPKDPANEMYKLIISGKQSGLFYHKGEVREW